MEGSLPPPSGDEGPSAAFAGPVDGDPLSDESLESLLNLLEGLDEETLLAIFEEYLSDREGGGG